ncbi:MAG: tetratricopeptide repeat protein [Blastocatellia bacterium]|nr:tetratricopeptide repeat protein [Blastocatellia bacterium]
MPLSTLRALACIALVISLVALPVPARQDPRMLYERACMLDESNRDLAEAIRLYGQFISQAKGPRSLAAKAQYRIGVLYERLGRKMEAQRAFKVVVAQYPDQVATASRAQAKIIRVAKGKSPDGMPIKRAGPSEDGRYLATFTFPVKELLSQPVTDTKRQRLYLIAKRESEVTEEGNKRGLRRVGRLVYWPSTLVVIDIKTDSIIKTVPFPVYLGSIAYNLANDRIYAAAVVDGHIKVIDPDTFATEAQIALPGYPGGPTPNPNTNKIYVPCQGFAGNDKLFVIDGATNAVTGPFDLNGSSGDVVVNPATNRIYVRADERMRVFDGRDNSVLADLEGLRVIEVDPVHNRIYAQVWSNSQIVSLAVLDGDTHDAIIPFKTIDIPASFAAVDPEANRLYVALPDANQIAVIDTASHTEVSRLTTARYPNQLTVDPSTGKLYVCDSLNDGTNMLIAMSKEALEQKDVPEEFFDDFDSADLDPAWAVREGQGSYSLKENSGHLRFRSAAPSGAVPYLMLSRKFRGDSWTLEAKVSYFTGASGGARYLRFGIAFGESPEKRAMLPDNGVNIVRHRDDWNGCCPGNIAIEFRENAVYRLLARLLPNEDEVYIWRIKRKGRTIMIKRSDDGTNFTVVAAHTFGSQIDGVAQYLFLTFNAHNNDDAYADYDYVRLSKARSVISYQPSAVSYTDLSLLLCLLTTDY